MTAPLLQQKHELWLQLLYGSFMCQEDALKSTLYDFAMIEFRHMRWLSRALSAQEVDYNYDRNLTLHEEHETTVLLRRLIDNIETVSQTYPSGDLASRMIEDERYFVRTLKTLLASPEHDKPITAFERHRTLPGKELDTAQRDALTLFLFEESYKEYELILVYAFMQNRSSDLNECDVYQDLIDESQFHFKAFGNLMAKMGILALPRELHRRTYDIADTDAFIRNGIEEEESAKEQCRQLSEAIRDEELSAFFDFINAQESYHIALMKQLLQTPQVSPK